VARIDPEKGLIYSSPAIHARRRRILDETRKLIAERGLPGFSMDEICQRADVAKRTLYNAFQTKERMIAIAIQEAFERFLARIPYTGEPGSLQGTIERLAFVVQRNRQTRNFLTAIMSVYFSSDADPEIRDTVHSVSADSNRVWIDALEARRQLQPWVVPEQLADNLVRIEYAIIYDWCRGNLPDSGIALQLLTAHLTCMAGATRGASRARIEEQLQQLRSSGVPSLPARAPRETAAARDVARTARPRAAAKPRPKAASRAAAKPATRPATRSRARARGS
jgi:AcrR family transcriptional regulator